MNSSSSKKTEKERVVKSSSSSGEMLELTLGFGSASSKASSSSSSFPYSKEYLPTKPCQEILALGLKLRFETDDENRHDQAPVDDHTSSQLNSHGLMSSWPFPNNVTLNHQYCFQRPQYPGLWFSLRSILNRDGEILPQIRKVYIRVKNENVTVFMVKTYLVTKLGLSDEAQVEISCMGQNLLHSQNLKNVRDEIWLPKIIEFQEIKSSNPPEFVRNNKLQHLLMSLDYCQKCSNSSNSS